MSSGGPVHPPRDRWIAAVHASEDVPEPLGAAVVLDSRRVLTCAHVVTSDGEAQRGLWVSFPRRPNTADDQRRLVASVDFAYERPLKDVAVLVLDQDVPVGVEPPRLLRPAAADLIGLQWWAFGFPDRDPSGNSADGVVGAALADGWLRLDTTSRYPIQPGFSGAGLWSPDYQAVVGLVGQAHPGGDGRAVTLRQAELLLPGQRLARLANWSLDAAGEVALAAWGWSLATDPEGKLHWRPRARGVTAERERGYRFRGRKRALTEIVTWLDRPTPDRRVLVVTGSPGVGKSAVLGRVVTTADATIRAELPENDTAERAGVGSVDCAVVAKAKSAQEVAAEIARAASARLPAEPGDLTLAVRDALEGDGRRRFSVIIDALDEAASPAQARVIISEIVLPLAETCSDLGVRVIVGTRRTDGDGSLLAPFAGTLKPIDLDRGEYFREEDLAAYAVACLELAGDERPVNPYADDRAWPVARRIAAMSQGNFLIAGLVARSHGMHDQTVVDPDDLSFGANIDTALAAYLRRVDPVAGMPANQVLTALAFAESPGLSAGLWQQVIKSLYGAAPEALELGRFARTSAANFLVESGANDFAEPVYRLFHQGLNDALTRARGQVVSRGDDERAITLALTAYGRARGWENAPEYLLRSLPGHSAAAGLIDELFADDAYLLRVDLPRLRLASGQARSAEAQRRVRMIGLTPDAVTTVGGNRAAMFSITDALAGLGTQFDAAPSAPYRARWSWARHQGAYAVLEGHQDRVHSVCAFRSGGRDLLASGGYDRTVRIWDPETGKERATLQGHQGWVTSLCAFRSGGRDLLASAGHDSTVRIWDPKTGQQRAILRGHQQTVTSVCAFRSGGRDLLVSGSGDATIRIWDPETGQQQAALHCSHDWVRSVCVIRSGDRDLIVGADATIRIWDPETGKQQAICKGHIQTVWSMCVTRLAGRDLIVSASGDATIRIWDPETGEQQAALEGHRDTVAAVCAIRSAGQDLIASASWDKTIRIWEPKSGKQQANLRSHEYSIAAVCAFRSGNRDLIAGTSGHTVRIWDAGTGTQRATLQGHQGEVHWVCAIRSGRRDLIASANSDPHVDNTIRIWDAKTGNQRVVIRAGQSRIASVWPVRSGGRDLLASAGGDGTVRIWDPKTGKQRAEFGAGQGWVLSGCPVRSAGRDLIASAGHSNTVQIWDPETGKQWAVLAGHHDWIRSVCPIPYGDRDLIASGSNDQTIRIWDPKTGKQRAILAGHQGRVACVCPVRSGNYDLVASVSDDKTIRIWEPYTATCVTKIPVHYEANTVAASGGLLIAGLTGGLIAIDLNLSLNPAL